MMVFVVNVHCVLKFMVVLGFLSTPPCCCSIPESKSCNFGLD